MIAPTKLTLRLAAQPLTPAAAQDHTCPRGMAGHDDDEKRRKATRALLNERAVHDEVRKIIRMKKVARDDVEDVLGAVILEATLAIDSIPAERTAAIGYLCGIARNECVDHIARVARERGRRGEMPTVVPEDSTDEDEPEEATADTRSVPSDEAAAAATLMERVRRMFPKTFDWYLRHRVAGERHEEIAAGTGKSPEAVRKTIAAIGRALASEQSKRGAIGLFVLLVIVFGLRMWRLPGGAPGENRNTLSHSATAPVPPPPVPPPSATVAPAPDALALRARARDEYAKGQWDLAVEDLDLANKLDPTGETPDLAALLDQANDRLGAAYAKPGDKPMHHHHTPGGSSTGH